MAGGTKATGNRKLSEQRVQAFIRDVKAGRVPPHSKLSDGDGMYLTVTAGGTPVWRVKYRHAGKESTYTVGPYGNEEHSITLAAARGERERVRAWLRSGRNPVQSRDVETAATVKAGGDTFAKVAEDWLGKRKPQWSEVHYNKSSQALERDVIPKLGHLPVSEIRPAMVSAVVEAIAKRGALDTAAKVLQHVSAVFRLAQASDLRRDNPAEPAMETLRAMRPPRAAQRHRPALLKWTELGEVLRAAEVARLSPAVRIAHRLCAFTAVRISNVVQAEWKEFDLEAEQPTWRIPRAKMKAQDRAHDHTVILGATIAEELRAWRKAVGSRGYVFRSPADESSTITREALEKAYRETLKLRDKHTPHGWRSALSTLARDEGGFERDVVELALDHIHDNEIVRAYDRGERLQERVRLMLWWDAQLGRAQAGADVVPLRRATATKA